MSDSEQRKPAEQEFNKLLGVFPQYVAITEGDGKRLYANDTLLDFFGFTQNDFLADDFRTRAYHPQDLERVESTLRRAMSSGESLEMEARIRRKDGQYRWVLMRARPARDERGLITRWYFVGVDIEDRKQAQEEVRQLVDAVPQHIVILAADGQPLYTNKVAQDYFGISAEECLDVNSLGTKIHTDDLTGYLETRQRGLSNGAPFAIEVPLRHSSGQYRWHLILFSPLRNAQGQIIRWYLTATNIEDRKRAEQELRRKTETLAIFQKLVQSSGEGILAFDTEGRYTVWNAALERIFGISEVERLGKQASDLCPFFHLTGGLKCYRDALAGKGVLATDVPYVFAETGKQIFLDAHFSPLLDEEERIIGGLAIIRDVTERKKAEAALRRSEAYLEEAEQLSHSGSFAHDVLRHEYIYWSRELYRTFGFDPAKGSISYEEARSRVHPEDLNRFDRTVSEAIRQKTGVTLDFRALLPDGSIRHIHCVSRPVLGASGEVVELVGTNMDVTEQYEARAALERAFDEIKQLKDEIYRENLVLKEQIDQAFMFEEIVGNSEPLRTVLTQVAKVAPTDSTVLIIGETGTGKELIARAIHNRSQRSSRAFVGFNCSATPQTLIGSELFGHERGAFTGASERRLGRFELANGGTLFLDEVGDLPAETQVALLRVLQERQFERVGGNHPIQVDVRIIAATNRDLKKSVAAGIFRSDLFYRLNVFPIIAPPLRDRKDDIPVLAEYFVERYAKKLGKNIKRIHNRTLELFRTYDWPGNIRELQNVIERAVILCDGGTFTVDESWLSSELPRTVRPTIGLARPGAGVEKELIENALAQTKGRVAGSSGAAAKLGIPRSTLETKIRRLRINKHRFQTS